MSKQKRNLLKRARSYENDARGLYAALDRLDDDDPESREAARVWAMQARHAENMANECYRYADRCDS